MDTEKNKLKDSEAVSKKKKKKFQKWSVQWHSPGSE